MSTETGSDVSSMSKTFQFSPGGVLVQQTKTKDDVGVAVHDVKRQVDECTEKHSIQCGRIKVVKGKEDSVHGNEEQVVKCNDDQENPFGNNKIKRVQVFQ